MQAGDCLAEKYELIRILGRGGMGTVWLAEHRTLGTSCAVKVLGGDFVPARVSRALREARVAAKLESEHAVRMLDAGTDADGRPWLAMEHLRGHDLAAVLSLHGPLTVARAAGLLLGVCDAVAEAHHRGVVHRDLKPANLFLAERDDGTSIVKVLDFGIAKLLDETEAGAGAVTASGAMIGSPRYVAPEQIRAAATADARADVWSLGVTLYEMLGGTTPFIGETSAAILAQIMADPVPPLGDRVAGLPPGLLGIVDRCLQKDPGKRYPSVAKLAADLAPFAPEGDRRLLARIGGWTAGCNATTEDDPSPRKALPAAAVADPTQHDTAATWSTRDVVRGGPRTSRNGLLVAGAIVAAVCAAWLLSPRTTVVARNASAGSSSPADSSALVAATALGEGPAASAPSASISAQVAASTSPIAASTATVSGSKRETPPSKTGRSAPSEPARPSPDRAENVDRTW